MKIALVHDWLTGMRGGEKCLEVFCELYPDAEGKKGTFFFSVATRSLTEVDGFMPHTARVSVGHICYHVINRGDGLSLV